MQFRALQTTSVCRLCRLRSLSHCHLVPPSSNHNPTAKVSLVSPVLREPVVSSHHRRKVHLLAVVYAPDVTKADMATTEIAFATGNENKLREASHTTELPGDSAAFETA